MRGHLTRFPVDWILENEEFVVRYGVWTLIPLEYVVLTRLPGGGGPNDLAFAGTAVVCVAIVLAFSAVVATFPRVVPTYEERLRRLSLAMIVTWGVTLLVVSLSYFIQYFIGLHPGEPGGVVAGPVAARLEWLAVNFVFVAIAIAFILAVSLAWRTRYAAPSSNACNPNIVVVAVVNTVLMTAVHGGASAFLGSGAAPALAAKVPAAQCVAFIVTPRFTGSGTAVECAAAILMKLGLTVSGTAFQDAAFVTAAALGAAIAPP